MKFKVKFQYALIFSFYFAVSFTFGQNVEVIGTVKISEMEIDNSVENLVVQKSDGTLVRRQLSSVPSPTEQSDTSRTFANDLEFAKLICNCTTIPPFLVESAIAAGYTGRQLYESGVDVASLFKGGIRLDSLIAYGESVQSLLMNTTATPMDLYEDGIAPIDIYGASYAGGLIFYIDTLDVFLEFEGMVSADASQNASGPWGCSGIDISGAEGASLGDGKQNTVDIVGGCNTAGISARLCDDLVVGSYDDWFLPNIAELTLMHENLHLLGFGGFEEFWYESSFELPTNSCRLKNFNTGAVGSGGKLSTFSVRAARHF